MNGTRIRNHLAMFLLGAAFLLLGLLVLDAFQAELYSGLEGHVRNPHSRDMIVIFLKIVLWGGVSILIVRALNATIFGVIFRLRRGYEAPNLVRNLFSIVAYAVCFVIIFKAFFPKVELAPVLATSTIFGVIIGLALQDTMGNLFAGLSLHADKPFQVGDVITLGQRCGVVESISWRAVKIRTSQNHFILVSNSSIAKEAIEVCPKENLNARLVSFNTLYSDFPARVIHVVREAVREADNVTQKVVPVVRIRNFGDSSVEWEVKYWLEDYSKFNDTDALLRQRIWYAFRRADLHFAFPTRTLHIEGRTRAAGEKVRTAAYAELFSSVDIFSPLTEAEIATLAESCAGHIFAPGEAVIREGDPGSSMFVIRKGHVQVLVTEGGKPKQMATLKEGDFFGEMALLTGEPRTASVVAVDETEVLEIGHQPMKRLFETNPELIAELSRTVAERRAALKARADAPGLIPDTPVGFLVTIKRFFGLS